MNDQVQALNARGIRACTINSTTNSATTTNTTIWHDIAQGKYALVYVSPEGIEAGYWKELKNVYRTCGITAFAIDEAHCMSEWGHDFRSAYRKLDVIRREFPNVPLTCLTATATQPVQNDVVKGLRLNEPIILAQSLNRPNLHYAVHRANTLDTSLLTRDVIGKEATIIYARRKRDVDDITKHLKSIDVAVEGYHAGMSSEKRKQVHDQFIRDELPCVVATVAFGMGIDKPDIRRVIHWGLPRSIEDYVQQSGRAGRDGLPSECILVYGGGDENSLRYLINCDENEENRTHRLKMVQQISQYVSTSGCRRAVLLQHFGEPFQGLCDACDNCTNAAVAVDLTTEARICCQAIKDTGERFGLGIPIALLRGSKKAWAKEDFYRVCVKKSKAFQAMQGMSERYIKELMGTFRNQGLIEEYAIKSGKFSAACFRLTDTGNKLLSSTITLPPIRLSNEIIALKLDNARNKAVKPETQRKPAIALSTNSVIAHLDALDRKLYESLLDVRKEQSNKYSLAPYMVMSNDALLEMVKCRPTSINSLSTLAGISQTSIVQYGQSFVDAIGIFRSQNPALVYDAPNGHEVDELLKDDTITDTKRDIKRKRAVEPTISQLKSALAPGNFVNPIDPDPISALSKLRRTMATADVSFHGSEQQHQSKTNITVKPAYHPASYIAEHERVTHAKLKARGMLLSGKSISEIAAERGIRSATVSSYLSDCILNGHDVPLTAFDIPESVEKGVYAYLQEYYGSNATREPPTLSYLKKELPENYEYGQIRPCLAQFRLMLANTDKINLLSSVRSGACEVLHSDP